MSPARIAELELLGGGRPSRRQERNGRPPGIAAPPSAQIAISHSAFPRARSGLLTESRPAPPPPPRAPPAALRGDDKIRGGVPRRRLIRSRPVARRGPISCRPPARLGRPGRFLSAGRPRRRALIVKLRSVLSCGFICPWGKRSLCVHGPVRPFVLANVKRKVTGGPETQALLCAENVLHGTV